MQAASLAWLAQLPPLIHIHEQSVAGQLSVLNSDEFTPLFALVQCVTTVSSSEIDYSSEVSAPSLCLSESSAAPFTLTHQHFVI